MFKTPRLGPVIAAMLLAGATVGLAAPTFRGGAIARVRTTPSPASTPGTGVHSAGGITRRRR